MRTLDFYQDKGLFTIHFNVLSLNNEENVKEVINYILLTSLSRINLSIDENRLLKFVDRAGSQYTDNPYHNIYHACQVLHTTYIILDECELFECFNPIILFATLISAFVHDIDHPGTTNKFEIEHNTILANMYHDNSHESSILEKHHCRIYKNIIDEINLLEYMNNNDEKELFEQTVTKCIMETDMTKHYDLVNSLREIKQYLVRKNKNIKEYLRNNMFRQITLSTIIVHGSDIGNAVLDYEHCRQWGLLLNQEAKYMKEKEQQMSGEADSNTDYLNDKYYNTFLKREIHFMSAYCERYWNDMVTLFNKLAPYHKNIVDNLHNYMLQDI